MTEPTTYEGLIQIVTDLLHEVMSLSAKLQTVCTIGSKPVGRAAAACTAMEDLRDALKVEANKGPRNDDRST